MCITVITQNRGLSTVEVIFLYLKELGLYEYDIDSDTLRCVCGKSQTRELKINSKNIVK
jgi:hypothetical protein